MRTDERFGLKRDDPTLTPEPLAFNVAVWRRDPSAPTSRVQRIAWKDDGLSGTDPASMDPSRWGVVTRPPHVFMMSSDTSSGGESLNYLSKEDFNFRVNSNVPTFRTSDNTIMAGGWYPKAYI